MNNEIFQIHLNSKYADKYYNNLNTDCEFFLPLIEVPLQHTIYISVQHAVIPYSFYNINSTNNLLIYTLNSVQYSITIAQGNYNAYDLLAYLKVNMPNINITYDSIVSKYTFSGTSSISFLSTSTCLEILGFPTSSSSTSINNVLTSTNCINLQSKHCICIQSNLQTGSLNNTHKNESNIICSIPIDKPPFSTITYQNHNNLRYNLYNNNISTLMLRLTDQNNNILDLNGCHWSISIQLEVIKFVE
jgi:hypothetical protein